MPTPMEYGRQEKKYRGAGGGPGKGPELVIPNPELKICLKELRESYRWLRWIPRLHLLRPPAGGAFG